MLNSLPELVLTFMYEIPLNASVPFGFIVTLAFVQPYVVDTFEIVGAVLSSFTVIVFVVLLPALSVATKVYLLEPSVLNV